MIVYENYSLQSLNSLGFQVHTKYAVQVNDEAILPSLLNDPRWQAMPKCVLGGGSNIVFKKDFPGLVIHITIPGKKIIQTTSEAFLIQAGAGENWHEFVVWTLAQGCPGLENLALIPGTVGAAPIQNVGAYGVEIAQYCHSLLAYDSWQKKFIELFARDCQFTYRHSLFKINPGRYIITQVRFLLPRTWQAQLAYAELANAVSTIAQPTPQEIFTAIVAIRSRKLPDPKHLGNAGSFFKNPIVTVETINILKKKFTDLPYYPQTNGSYKLAAGWLIEQCGFKGIRRGPVGVYKHQALILVHFGAGNGLTLLALAEEIQTKVKARFGIDLEYEPVII